MKNILLQSNKIFIERLKEKAIYKNCFKVHKPDQYPYTDANNFFQHYWKIFDVYKKSLVLKGEKINNQVPGDAFEIIIGFILDYEKIEIYSMDENVEGVLFVKPDFTIRDERKNIFISCKTSTRERWKQADWESIRYKKKYPNAKCFVITNHEQEARSLRNKLNEIDIDKIFYSGSNEINDFIKQLK